MTTQFNEMTRVQFPGLIHLIKLGYDFIPKNVVESIKDPENNILIIQYKFRAKNGGYMHICLFYHHF